MNICICIILFLRAIDREFLWNNSIFGICAYDYNQIAAMSRVVEDGTISLYVADIVVDSKYQGRGIEKEMMIQLVAWLNEYKKTILI